MLNVLKTLTSGILEVAKSYKGDWNENDSASPNYVKNRTHWSEITYKQFFNETLQFEEYHWDDWNQSYYMYGPISQCFIPGETYVVKWNGKEYKCVAQQDPYWSNTVLIGNVNLVPDWGYDGIIGHNNEPFFIATNSDYGEMSIYTK